MGMEQIPAGHHPWYGHWWGKLLIGLIVFCSVILVVFVVITLMFWWQIKHGQTPGFGLATGSSFTASFAAPRAVQIDRSRLETTDDPSLGRSGARVTIVEFLDFKCPNCRAAAPIMDKVIADFGTKVHWIVRNFPVESTHPGATQLSELAYCADQQHHFWPMYHVLFDEQDTLPSALDDATIAHLADRSGTNAGALANCLTSDAASQKVQTDYLTGISAGVRGTPTFFVNGEKVEGVVPYAAWDTFLSAVK